MKQLSDEAIRKVLNIPEESKHLKYAKQELSIGLVVARKAEQEILRQVVEPANQRIEALQKLLICYRIGKHPTEKLFAQLEKSDADWQELKKLAEEK